MNLETTYLSKTHFHIRWSAGSLLDWEAFETRTDAEEVAQQLACATEVYRIEEFGQTCRRCAKFWRDKLPHTKRKYRSTDMKRDGGSPSVSKLRKRRESESVGA